MAIKISSAGSIPAVTLDYVHFDKLNMSISRSSPARIALTADVCLYGTDVDGNKVFNASGDRISITDLMQFIASLPPEDQAVAVDGFNKVQEGLGILAQKYFGWTFEAVE